MIEAWPDMINGTLELVAGVFIALSVWKLHKDKKVRGVSYVHVGFFTAWGFWNLFFFPHYDLWFSFVGGVGVLTANTIWLCQMLYYTWQEEQRVKAHFKRNSIPWGKG